MIVLQIHGVHRRLNAINAGSHYVKTDALMLKNLVLRELRRLVHILRLKKKNKAHEHLALFISWKKRMCDDFVILSGLFL